MGLFSDPVLVDFENFNERELLESGVALQSSEPKSPSQTKKAARTASVEVAKIAEVSPSLPTPEPLPVQPASLSPPPKAKVFLEKFRLSWTPEYMLSKISSPDNFTTHLNGFVPLSVTLERNAELFWKIHYSQAKFAPDPADKYPFQTDLSVSELDFQIGKNNLYQDRAWGVELKRASWFERTGDESIQTKEDMRAGLVLQAGEVGTHLLVGSFTQELNLDYKKIYLTNKLFYGFGVEGSLLSEKAKLSEVLKLILIFGFASQP